MTWFKSSVAVAAIVAVASAPLASGFAQVATAQETLQDLVGQGRAEVAALPADQQYGAEELDTLVAPVALYPDALLAQVLVAATYPLQVVKADRLLDETEGLSDDEVARRIAGQDWDPSVMVLLSGFPTVIQRMADDLDWTERLGTAMVGQDQDVLAAVQRMRTQALDTGWLQSNDAQVVERRDDAIAIRPADPDVVYVPNYDSSLAFTSAPTAQPYVAPPSNPLANPWVAGAVAFGAALLVQQLFEEDDDDHNDRGWNDYWRRSEPFDWRERQFYPRPVYPRAGPGWQRDRYAYAWSRERDDHWDRSRGGWAYDAQARAERERERRAAVAWTSRPGSEGMGRIGDLRTVARERPAQPPAVYRRPPAALPPARATAERPAAPKPGARPDNRRPPARARAPAAKPDAVATRPAPKPDAKPAARPTVQDRPAAKPAPKPAAQPRPKPDAKLAPKPEPAAAKKPVPTPAAKPKVEPAAPAKPKPAAKPVPKPAAKPAAVPAKPPAAKKVAPPKPAPKPAVAAKPAAKTVAAPKPAPKPAAQPKPAPKAAQQSQKPAVKKPACKPGDEKCRRQNG